MSRIWSYLKIPLRAEILLWGVIGGIVFAAIWSGSFVATKIALADIDPLWLAGLRLTSAGILLMALTGAQVVRVWRSLTRRHTTVILLSGLLSQGFYLAATYWSLVELPTGVVNVIVAALPLVSVPMAFLVLRESLDAVDATAAALGLLGIVIVVMGRDAGALTVANLTSPAVILTVASVFALALGNALIKPLVSAGTIIPVCAMQMILSGLVVTGIAAFRGGFDAIAFSRSGIEAFAYLVLIGSIAGTFLWFKVLMIFTAKAASMFFLFTPVFGLIIGWAMLDEPMTTPKLLGAAIVCGSIFLRGAHALMTRRQPAAAS